MSGEAGRIFDLAFERAWFGDVDGAIALYREFLAGNGPDPGVEMCLGQFLLLKGDFLQGFILNERRPQNDLPAPCWRGQPIDGKRIFIRGEQGFGDNIQFIRYAGLVAARGAIVEVGCPAGLGRLLSTVPGVSRVIEPGMSMDVPDLAVSLMSLPYVFGTRKDTIPAQVPYIRPDPGLVADWRRVLGAHGGLKVGLVWGGDTRPSYDWRRSPGLEPYLRLLEVPGVTFFSLQKGGAAQALEGRTMPANFVDLGPALDSFDATAAVMEGLDLVISSCTSCAHLAGALARPVWVVLSGLPDWRWLLTRDDSPWYPTARLFRAAPGGAEWGDVLDRVKAELRLAAAKFSI